MLFGLAHRDDIAASELRREFDLDDGYLSHILSDFTTSGIGGQGQVGGRWPSPGRPPDRRWPAGVRRAEPAAGMCNLSGARAVGRRSANSTRRRDGSDPPNAEQRDAPVPRRSSAPQPGGLGSVVERHGALICDRIRLGRDVRGICRADRRRVCRVHCHETSPVRRQERRRAPAGCLASWPAAGHPSSPSCACRSTGS